jgi:hypothetical protein
MEIVWKPLDIYDQVCEYLENQKEDEILSVYIWKAKSKESRTLAQNRTFYKLFTDIWNHIWYTKEEVKEFMLWWVFWTKTVKHWPFTKEINIENHTHLLSKEQWIFFIESILEFCKTNDIPITITSREIESLFDSFKSLK